MSSSEWWDSFRGRVRIGWLDLPAGPGRRAGARWERFAAWFFRSRY